MENEKQCNKYEGLFIFNNDEEFLEHIKNCPSCKKEHEKYLKVSALVKEVAPVYLEKQEKNRMSILTKIACCFIFMVGLSAFTGYKMYDTYTFQAYSTSDDSYISSLGLPTDDYGFFEFE